MGAEPLKQGRRLARGISFAPVSRLSHESRAAWTLVGLLVPDDVFHFQLPAVERLTQVSLATREYVSPDLHNESCSKDLP